MIYQINTFCKVVCGIQYNRRKQPKTNISEYKHTKNQMMLLYKVEKKKERGKQRRRKGNNKNYLVTS